MSFIDTNETSVRLRPGVPLVLGTLQLRRVLAGSAAPRSVALADAALALSGDPSLGPVHGDLADALGRDLFL